MSTPDVVWRSAIFDELSGREVHDLLRLRQDVFVVEQACAFAEIDGRDPDAVHLFGYVDGRLVACARVFAPGIVAAEASIGRVVTATQTRGTGVGRALMREALRLADALAPGAPVRVAAQAHLEAFYASLGFSVVGDPYLDDGIVHVDMVRPGPATE